LLPAPPLFKCSFLFLRFSKFAVVNDFFPPHLPGATAFSDSVPNWRSYCLIIFCPPRSSSVKRCPSFFFLVGLPSLQVSPPLLRVAFLLQAMDIPGFFPGDTFVSFFCGTSSLESFWRLYPFCVFARLFTIKYPNLWTFSYPLHNFLFRPNSTVFCMPTLLWLERGSFFHVPSLITTLFLHALPLRSVGSPSHPTHFCGTLVPGHSIPPCTFCAPRSLKQPKLSATVLPWGFPSFDGVPAS